MVSVPLWRAGEIDGVLNVLAVRKDAFSPVDRTYITLLASGHRRGKEPGPAAR